MPGLYIAEITNPDQFGELAPPMQVALFLGALSFAVSALVSVTAFTRIIIVLSFVRRALTTSEIPPNPVLMGLAIFLTMFVMAPTLERIYEGAIAPLMAAQQSERALADGAVAELPGDEIQSASVSRSGQEKFTAMDAWKVASRELSAFMLHNTRRDDLALFLQLAKHPEPDEEHMAEVPLHILVPAFVISELKTAFIMGFCIYIPFLLVDLVVSTLLMSLGMMMMTPATVATPCKLLLFVLVDGWHLISKSLVESFG